MRRLCASRRRLTHEDAATNPNVVPIMNPEQEPDEWEFVNLDGLGTDEDQIWMVPCFDDKVSESSSDEQADVSAGRPPQQEELDYPNLKRGRLVMLGFRSSEDTMPCMHMYAAGSSSASSNDPPPQSQGPDEHAAFIFEQGQYTVMFPPQLHENPMEAAEAWRRFRRAMHRWQHARLHVTRILTLRKIWSNLGRVLSQWPQSTRNSNEYRKAARIWGQLGRTLQRLNSRALMVLRVRLAVEGACYMS